ncbi:FAD:protein FMN transferase [Phaeobacter gallaeciensis]|uniref:FAD:protein FMN transferase n=1 Tax=Phaeobacter gallaeciensis TaxID=60890 RepID=UPI000BBBA57A|nr:FAD:protein FMN transferase [Phaeobacter gallaeciensis]ATF20351.1 Membrane-associated lipoprotein involved in thiamine biosynthesis [Phaeobacter gallaeciensis]ATF24460.1 Membrane-associated lipoprotein involved in thiamine biosynthesis [Phaeobacter gallaeciensis]
MTLNRRRFLTIAAAFAATPAVAKPHHWQGRAFGADVAITLSGPSDVTKRALHTAQNLIAQMERRFSLFQADSELVRLNTGGSIVPSAALLHLMQLSDAAHQITQGLFDPTVQPMWRALAEGRRADHTLALVDWTQVSFAKELVQLGQGQALTFNGIAQGYATDVISDFLAEQGFNAALVNIGEFRASGGDWRLGIADPFHGLLATRRLSEGAVATSSPMATPLGSKGHILHPKQHPHWSTVSVEADSAAMADALSTGLVLADLELVRKVRHIPGIHRITLISEAGDLTTL